MSAPELPSLFVSHWSLQPGIDAAAGAALALYGAGVARTHGRWPLRRSLAFAGGVGAIVVATGSGIAAYDDRMLSVHMTQHMILLLAAPLLLIAGRPLVLALRALPRRPRAAVARTLPRLRRVTGPWQGLAAYCAIVVLAHTSRFYDAAIAHPVLHDTEHGLYLLAGALLLWPILDGDPAPAHRLGGLAKLVYVIAAMVPMAAIGAYLNRHLGVVYAPYGTAARVLKISATDDQAVAGAIMWVAGNTTMVLVGLWAVMQALSREERRQRSRDAHDAHHAHHAHDAGLAA
jgi:putative copper resistance protein D